MVYSEAPRKKTLQVFFYHRLGLLYPIDISLGAGFQNMVVNKMSDFTYVSELFHVTTALFRPSNCNLTKKKLTAPLADKSVCAPSPSKVYLYFFSRFFFSYGCL